jgi:leader peptidase (prepilin peptidase)/N-methyltransferase
VPAWSVEVVVGLALVVLALRLHDAQLLPLLAVCWLVLIGTVLAFVDLAVHRLPNRLTGAAVAGVLALLGAAAVDQDRFGRLGWAVVCGISAAAGYLVMAFIYPAGLGMGDVKLAIALGMLLGWWGGTATLLGIAAGFFVNGVLGAVLLATGRVRRGDQLPHGPAMLLGALGTIAALGG